MSIQPNKKKSIDSSIFAAYKQVHETSEEHLAPEYRQRSDEAPRPGEEIPHHGGSVKVHGIEVEVDHEGARIVKCEVIECSEFCPHCCLNDFTESGDFTEEDIAEYYKVDKKDEAIYIENKEGTERYIFVVCK